MLVLQVVQRIKFLDYSILLLLNYELNYNVFYTKLFMFN